MRMVIAARLVDHRDRAAKRRISLLHDEGVSDRRHHMVGITRDVDQSHAGLRKWLERVDRITRVGQRGGLVGEAIRLQAVLPVTGTPLTFALAARPRRKVANLSSASADPLLEILAGQLCLWSV